MERLYTQRLVILAILFGVIFGFLFLFSNDLSGLIVVGLLVSSTVFVARREDLKALFLSKTFVFLIITFTILTVTASISAVDLVGSYLFEGLSLLSVFFLLCYIVASRRRRQIPN